MNDAKILLADDSAFMRMMLKSILVKHGFEIVGEASDGFEAVEKYRELVPDLLLMDITMPNMGGLQALKIIRGEFPQAKIIMCSAMGQESFISDAVKSGACGFIVKPFKADKIVDHISKYL